MVCPEPHSLCSIFDSQFSSPYLGDKYRQEHNGNDADPGDDESYDGLSVRFSDLEVEHRVSLLFEDDRDAGFSELVFLANRCVEDGVESVQFFLG